MRDPERLMKAVCAFNVMLLGARHRHLRYAMVALLLFAALVLSSALVAPSAHAQTVAVTVSVGSSPNGVAYDSAKGEIFVTNQDSNTVSIISDSTSTTTTTTSTTSVSTISSTSTSSTVPEFPTASLTVIALVVMATVTLLSRKFYARPLTRIS